MFYRREENTLQIFNLDRCTHRYLIEPVSQCLHPKVMLASRYATFMKSLVNSNKFNVRFLARLFQADHMTVMGRTMGSLLDQCSLNVSRIDELSATAVKKNCCYFRMPATEQWRGPLLKELINIRDGQLLLGEFETEEIKFAIDHLCLS